MHRRAYALLLLFMSGPAAAKKVGKAKLMHSMIIKPHVLGSNDAWKNAKKICDGGVPRAARPILVFVHIFKSAGTTTRETLKQYSARREAASATATCRFVMRGTPSPKPASDRSSCSSGRSISHRAEGVRPTPATPTPDVIQKGRLTPRER